MTHSQAKSIFVGGALISLLFVVALTYDSHMKFALNKHEDKLTSQVASGKWVWQKYNCNGCHTILGTSGYYAPDVTKVMGCRDSDG